jgi:hypothetical protein
MNDLYEGIDFANHCDRLGQCYLKDDGNVLSVSVLPPKDAHPVRRAVDCPFGTSLGFQ